MSTPNDTIENLFGDAFSDYREMPSEKSWRKILFKLYASRLRNWAAWLLFFLLSLTAAIGFLSYFGKHNGEHKEALSYTHLTGAETHQPIASTLLAPSDNVAILTDNTHTYDPNSVVPLSLTPADSAKNTDKTNDFASADRSVPDAVVVKTNSKNNDIPHSEKQNGLAASLTYNNNAVAESDSVNLNIAFSTTITDAGRKRESDTFALLLPLDWSQSTLYEPVLLSRKNKISPFFLTYGLYTQPFVVKHRIEYGQSVKNEQGVGRQSGISIGAGRGRWHLESGIAFQRINPKSSNLLFAFKTNDLQSGLEATDQSDSPILSDTSAVAIPVTYIYKSAEQMRQWVIPVSLSYKVYNQRLSVAVRAGVAANFYAGEKIQLLPMAMDAAAEAVSNEATQLVYVNPYLKKAFVSWHTGVEIDYALSPVSHLYISPLFQGSFNSITRNSYPLSQKYNTAGLQLGIRWTIQ